MTDLVTLALSAGNGGNGRVSFHREKFILKGGPDGGHGGDGGHVIIRATRAKATLSHYAGVTELEAQPGQPGGRKKKIGAKSAPLVLEVPLGTVVWCIGENAPARARREHMGLGRLVGKDSAHHKKYYVSKEQESAEQLEPQDVVFFVPAPKHKNKISISAQEFKALQDASQLSETSENHMIELHQFLTDGEELVICQGGYGGRGNEAFKSGGETTPLLAEYGTPGERRVVILEQKLLADVGLLGLPSAGKSTLLSVLTKARPKIAAYHFTTLEPQLGVLASSGVGGTKELVIADLPGLIEGASEGKGLGLDFLRHLEHTKVLLYVLSIDEHIVYDEHLTPAQKAEGVWEQFVLLRKELATHNTKLLQKNYLLSLNKLDIYTPELQEEVKKLFTKNGETSLYVCSAATGEGMPELIAALFETA